MEYSAHFESSYGQENEQWEHYVAIITAEVNEKTWSEVSKYYPDRPRHDVPIYAVQAMLVRLNKLGEQGWRLVSMQPVIPSEKGDVLMEGVERSFTGRWTHSYLCSFVRRKRTQ